MKRTDEHMLRLVLGVMEHLVEKAVPYDYPTEGIVEHLRPIVAAVRQHLEEKDAS